MTLEEWNAELEAIAARYRRALSEIAEDCTHDRPVVDSIFEIANGALSAARQPGTLAELIQQVGEAVSVFYEPRNEPDTWMVGLERVPMLHEHFESLTDGLRWLVENRARYAEWEERINALSAEAERGYDVSTLRARPRSVNAEVVEVRMPPEQKAAVERRAASEMTSVSEIVRAAVDQWLGPR